MYKQSLKLILIALSLGLAASVHSKQLESIESAYEVPAADVIALTAGDRSVIVFKPCPKCADKRASLVEGTMLIAYGAPVSRDAFRPLLRKSKGWVYIFINIKTGKVRKIELEQ